MKVIKRNGNVVEFERCKISDAIKKAMKYGSGIRKFEIARSIASEIENEIENDGGITSIYKIEDMVFHKLIEYKQTYTARKYEEYRTVQAFKRQKNTTDEDILSLISGSNIEVQKENSNKNEKIASTQRDYIAGEVSKDMARRKLIPSHIIQAHDDGVLHWHDMDYTIQRMFNCCLVDIKDMLDNGTVINNKMVENPKSFQTACTITTQIIAQIASGQYGGQSVNLVHLAPYVRKSYYKCLEQVKREQEIYKIDEPELAKKIAWDRTKLEVKAGIQTMQYQINTLMTTNGQAPFVTLFMHIQEGEYEKEMSMMIEEVFLQRIQGIKNEVGVYITPAFPKLIYVLDECNMYDGKYNYLTKLSAICSAKRMYPDYLSAKKMRSHYEGNVFSPMGCRSFLSPWINPENGEYKFEGRFNQGVVSLNLPQIGIVANGDMDLFWELLSQRLNLCFEALMTRHKLLLGTTSDISPIHWQYGGLSRLKKGEKIDKLLFDGYSTISLGYIGLYELTKVMTGKSHTEEKEFALKVLNTLREHTDKWKKETGLGFGLYGTPAESLCYRFARLDKKNFGEIEDITSKGYYTNSYHVDVREEIDAFSKLEFESEFQKISSGGAISYVEMANMIGNPEAIEQVQKFIYENIQYAEFNTKSDNCHICGYEGEITINDNLEWECPQCHNKDENAMSVTRRTCGYLGENLFNPGKTQEIKNRVLHL